MRIQLPRAVNMVHQVYIRKYAMDFSHSFIPLEAGFGNVLGSTAIDEEDAASCEC